MPKNSFLIEDILQSPTKCDSNTTTNTANDDSSSGTETTTTTTTTPSNATTKFKGFKKRALNQHQHQQQQSTSSPNSISPTSSLGSLSCNSDEMMSSTSPSHVVANATSNSASSSLPFDLEMLRQQYLMKQQLAASFPSSIFGYAAAAAAAAAGVGGTSGGGVPQSDGSEYGWQHYLLGQYYTRLFGLASGGLGSGLGAGCCSGETATVDADVKSTKKGSLNLGIFFVCLGIISE